MYHFIPNNYSYKHILWAAILIFPFYAFCIANTSRFSPPDEVYHWKQEKLNGLFLRDSIPDSEQRSTIHQIQDNCQTRFYSALPLSTDDNDNDGLADNVDLDDDNDGILDWDEMQCSVSNLQTVPSWTLTMNTDAYPENDFAIGQVTNPLTGNSIEVVFHSGAIIGSSLGHSSSGQVPTNPQFYYPPLETGSYEMVQSLSVNLPAGYSYITFAEPVTNPIIHFVSLSSTIRIL